MKSSLPVQLAIISFYQEALLKKDKTSAPKKERGRNGGAWHLRIAPSGEKLLQSICPCVIEDSDVSISGKYRNLVLILKKAIPGLAKIGDGCYLVVTASASGKGTLTTKQLTPNSLGVATGKEIGKGSFLKTIESAIDKNKTIPGSMREALKSVLEASSTPGGTVDNKALNGLSKEDLNTIGKDFGEISGALWYMMVHDKSVTRIEFPTAANEPLVDYYAVSGTKRQAISAKAGGGAAASVGNVADILAKKTYTDPKKEMARRAIIALKDGSIVDGTLMAARDLGTPGYQWLKKHIFKNKDFTSSEIEQWLSSYRSYRAMWADLEGFYKANGPGGGQGEASVADAIFKSGGRRIGFVIAPLGYDLKDVMNKDASMTAVLNDATSSINVQQVYMNIRKNGTGYRLDYEVHGFESTGFLFHWQNGVRTLGNKITMKMKVAKV
jgi:hypothetical protein